MAENQQALTVDGLLQHTLIKHTLDMNRQIKNEYNKIIEFYELYIRLW